EVSSRLSSAARCEFFPLSLHDALPICWSVEVMVTAAEQLSVAVAEPVFAASVGSPHWSCWSAGSFKVGGVVSTKTMCWTPVAMLPGRAPAFQVVSMRATLLQLAAAAAS